MAEAALSFAVENLTNLVIQKVSFLQGVEGKVNSLKDELKRMQSFLQDANEKQVSDKRIRNWISEIRDVALDAEDVIDTFILKVDTPRNSKRLLERFTYLPWHVNHLNQLGGEIESIQGRLQEIDKSRERYGIQKLDDGPARLNDVEHRHRRKLSPMQRDKHLVGLEKDVKLLLKKVVLEEGDGFSIATIAGMGGSGKSTLAREVFNHNEVAAGRFECRAWVVVSEEFNLRETIKEVMLQLLEPNDDKLKVLDIMQKTSEEDLKRMLHQRLQGRRYFIVLDDVWRQENWESLASAFPDEQGITSRLLVTSRDRNVVRTAQYIHDMKPLDPAQSWQLLMNKAFDDNSSGKCPPELEDIGRVILKKCGGLPLAITVIGGLLLEKKQSRSGWVKVLKEMNSYLGRIGNSVISATLELSYHNLPPQLKSCFLCLGFFKEDATIHAEKLLQVWIAEGLISQEGGEKTKEEVARGYLDELINRNIVQVKAMNKHDQVKSCRIHDLIRDLAIKKAKEEIGFELLWEGIKSQASDKIRHCAIYYTTKMFTCSGIPIGKHLRSLFFHGDYSFDGAPSYNWKSFTLLKVLDFEGSGLTKLPDAIGDMTGLKYLGLRYNKLKELPNSLGRVKNLQVLDIVGNTSIKVPNVIWKMDSLRHFYMSTITLDVPLKLDTLRNLQTLVIIWTDRCWPKHLIEMTNLRKLDVSLDNDIDVGEFITSLAKLRNLAFLKLRWSFTCQSLDGLVNLLHLTELKLVGALITLPNVDKFPPHLSHLTLEETNLRSDPIPVLEKLPKLLYLKLKYGAYAGRHMKISNDGFPRLRILLMRRLPHLESIHKVGEGGISKLERCEIRYCRMLERIPNWLTLSQEFKILGSPLLESLLSKLANLRALEDDDNCKWPSNVTDDNKGGYLLRFKDTDIIPLKFSVGQSEGPLKEAD